MNIKPGYRTSEFWFTLVSFVFSGLYLLGIIGDMNQKEDLIRDVSHAVESAILIGGQLTILYKYINSRKEIKQTWWSTASETERTAIPQRSKSNATPASKSTSSKRSRKSSKSNKNISK